MHAVVLAVIAVCVGCASSPTPDVKSLTDSLSLELTLRSPAVRVGETVDAAVTLRNHGTGVLDACLGEGLSYHIFGSKADKGRLLTIDHPRCVRRFRLVPGETLEWSEPILIGEVGPGPARLSASVQIVAVDGCDRLYGCYDTHVSTSFIPLVIEPAPSAAK